MALSLEKIKRDFIKNQKRTAILGVLVLVLAGFSVKAYFEMAPSHASADAGPGAADANIPATPAEGQLTAAESESRIRQSKQLWAALREVKKEAVTPALAFAFSPENFPEDPNRPRPQLVEHTAETSAQPITTIAHDLDPEKRKAEILARSSRITVMSTVLGSGATKSVVLLNITRQRQPGQQGIYKVGDVVEGFEIVSIQARKIVLQVNDIQVLKGMTGQDEVVETVKNNESNGGANATPK